MDKDKMDQANQLNAAPIRRLRPFKANTTTCQTSVPDVNVETVQSKGGGQKDKGTIE